MLSGIPRTTQRRKFRVDGKWKLDVHHPAGPPTEATVTGIWMTGGWTERSARVMASVRDDSMRQPWVAAVTACPCCDLPCVVSYRLANSTTDLTMVLTADSRRMLGELIWRIAEEHGLLADWLAKGEGKPKPNGA